MAFFRLLLGAALIASVKMDSSGLPKFSWDESRSSEHGVPYLVVTFPDGTSDVALLKRSNPIPLSPNEKPEDVDNCIFTGKLLNDPQVPVSVTGGCPSSDTFEITILSSKLSNGSFKVDKGVVTGLKSPWTRDSPNDAVIPPQ